VQIFFADFLAQVEGDAAGTEVSAASQAKGLSQRAFPGRSSSFPFD